LLQDRYNEIQMAVIMSTYADQNRSTKTQKIQIPLMSPLQSGTETAFGSERTQTINDIH
jgi:hypothetical protein